MTLVDIYLICFILGLALSVVSFVLGHVDLHLHLPFNMHIGHPHVHMPHVHGPHAGGADAGLPFINFGTITAFLAWFGGVGYLLSRYSHFYAVAGLGLSVLAGLFGATLVFLLVGKLIAGHDKSLDPMDYDMVGVLGRVSSPIRADGVGEIVFSQEGTRRSAGARSDTGREIPKGLEVVVTRFERGIAYVRPWAELSADHDASAANQLQ